MRNYVPQSIKNFVSEKFAESTGLMRSAASLPIATSVQSFDPATGEMGAGNTTALSVEAAAANAELF